VTRLIHKICKARSGIGNFKNKKIVNMKSKSKLTASMYLINIRILSYILLPSEIAETIVE